MSWKLTISLALIGVLIGCRPAGVGIADTTLQGDKSTTSIDEDWTGVFASTSESSGFSSTVLCIEQGRGTSPKYRMRFRTDNMFPNAIGQEEMSGKCIIENNSVYIPLSFGAKARDKYILKAGINKYIRVNIKDQTVLLEESRYDEYSKTKDIPKTGILIRVATDVKTDDLSLIELPSLSLISEN